MIEAHFIGVYLSFNAGRKIAYRQNYIENNVNFTLMNVRAGIHAKNLTQYADAEYFKCQPHS